MIANVQVLSSGYGISPKGHALKALVINLWHYWEVLSLSVICPHGKKLGHWSLPFK
jgi:hypothetical protein